MRVDPIDYVRNMKPQYKYTLGSAFVMGVLSQGMGLFNKYSVHDDAMNYGVGATYSSGRWMLDILEKAEIRTRRPESDLALLRSIRNGDYMKDSILNESFYEIVADYEDRFADAERNSSLPDNPDMEAVGRFVESVNRRAVMEDHS